MICELCSASNEILLWSSDRCRVILVDDADYPGFCRVIWKEHIKEMTDLPQNLRNELMQIVFAVENAVREVLQPEKINLASLGNMVPHLHWHVIPRFKDDKHFPSPIWGTAVRASKPSQPMDLLAPLKSALIKQLQN